MPFYNSFTFEIIRIWPCTLIAKINICLFSPFKCIFKQVFWSKYLTYFDANSNNSQKVCHETTGVFIIKADFPWKEWEQSDLSRLKACVSSTRYVAQSILAIMEFKYFTNKLNLKDDKTIYWIYESQEK